MYYKVLCRIYNEECSALTEDGFCGIGTDCSHQFVCRYTESPIVAYPRSITRDDLEIMIDSIPDDQFSWASDNRVIALRMKKGVGQ